MNAISTVVLESVITCPECGASKQIDADGCLPVVPYECTTCKKLLKPKAGDCCVFCSYGTVSVRLFSSNEAAARTA